MPLLGSGDLRHPDAHGIRSSDLAAWAATGRAVGNQKRHVPLTVDAGDDSKQLLTAAIVITVQDGDVVSAAREYQLPLLSSMLLVNICPLPTSSLIAVPVISPLQEAAIKARIKSPLACHLTFHPGALIDATLWPLESTKAIHLSGYEATFIAASIRPLVGPVAVHFVIVPISFMDPSGTDSPLAVLAVATRHPKPCLTKLPSPCAAMQLPNTAAPPAESISGAQVVAQTPLVERVPLAPPPLAPPSPFLAP
eukprot:CAMPEP_0178432650 /NCGR_PEP_ID=MMETSP0689_2-20121128/32498_1 /TAXON_ID=160604 /ORGANISM="Amphidinium massartii, Strain CS-259" /LENGTH=251 /DNA_ID=CAMNT_0020054651 /DNA_START=485 /DNA_END=1238 /DNA_ORIENTATION=+